MNTVFVAHAYLDAYALLHNVEYLDIALSAGAFHHERFEHSPRRKFHLFRAVGSTDPLIESAPSNEACVDNRDVTAPATPAGVAVLPREGGLEVLWGPSADADLAGYRVYRAAAGAARERIAEAATNRSSWVDDTARRGVTYAYTVTAFDQAGNESAPAEPVEASLP